MFLLDDLLMKVEAYMNRGNPEYWLRILEERDDYNRLLTNEETRIFKVVKERSGNVERLIKQFGIPNHLLKNIGEKGYEHFKDTVKVLEKIVCKVKKGYKLVEKEKIQKLLEYVEDEVLKKKVTKLL